ncbi:DNA topoisomerase [Paracoccus litorisediminis]|uniref:DNA topoisomerase n=1 Tax=Paracoccus litorisediminis TaxID=2006130 RepID=UPI00372DDD48
MQALIFIEANGKARAWSRVTRRLGMTANVMATSGHVCTFPQKLFPVGINLGATARLEMLRQPIPEKRDAIIAAVRNLPEKIAIIIATDDDVEGDVIAYDLAEIIFKAFPDRSGQIVRVRPGPITNRGIRTSLASARPLKRHLNQMTSDAIPGRARAVTDRWIGATFSKIANAPVGRVRSAIVGGALMMNVRPGMLRGKPETGEITLQARSASGGRPFVARVSLTGSEPKEIVARLRALATRFAGKLIPGCVRPAQSLSAAVAPRIGTVRPFNTADALVHAARHHAIPVKMAMTGLQDAYLQGMVSYPRTDSRAMSNDSAAHVQMIGTSCGIAGLEVEVLSSETMLGQTRDGAHEGLHPVLPLTTENCDRLRELVRRPVRIPEGGWDRNTAMQAMVALVSRRAFEASREIFLERGNWSTDNGGEGLDPADLELLRDLDWFRDKDFTFPWTRNYATGVKKWPMDAVLLEMMAEEGIARPSTYANHVATAMECGDLIAGEFPNAPRPSPKGLATLKKLPTSLWNPAVCRMIETALENEGNRLREDESASLQSRARHRVLYWLRRVPDEIRLPLLDALKSNGDLQGIGSLVQSAPAADAGSVFDIPEAPASPSPYN